MLNNAVVVGRLYDIYDQDHILLKIPSHREKDKDTIIKIRIVGVMKGNLVKYCKIGDLIGIKAEFTGIFPDDELLATKVTYLSRNNEEN